TQIEAQQVVIEADCAAAFHERGDRTLDGPQIIPKIDDLRHFRNDTAGRPRVTTRSEGSESLVAGPGNVKQRVQLGQLEERAQVLVQVREPQLAALLANLLRQADQYAQTGRVDIACRRKIDQEL